MNDINELLEIISSLGGSATVDEIATAYAKRFRMPKSLVSKSAISSELNRNIDRIHFTEAGRYEINNVYGEGSLSHLQEPLSVKQNGDICSWLIPCNVDRYNPFEAFKNLKTIDWRQSTKVNPGDFVYIYVSKPYGKVMFKTVVTKSNIPPKDVDTSDSIYNKKFREENGPEPKFGYMRLQLVSTADTTDLSAENLKQYGLKAAPQGPCKLGDRLLAAIDKHFFA